MQIDPRSVARDIPGVLDEVFPQLTPGIVAHFNASAVELPVVGLPAQLLADSVLQPAMLFELGCVVGERLTAGEEIDWAKCLDEAVTRQRAFFDAVLPDQLQQSDRTIAEITGSNLAAALKALSQEKQDSIIVRPGIPGLEWISTGQGDFAIGDTLIEIKCTARNFSASDYRQIAIYWLLSFAAAVEGRGKEWQEFVLLNPRRGFRLSMRFDTFLSVISSGRAKVETYKLFESIVGSRLVR